MSLGKPSTPLSEVLPPLIFGAGAFNYQYTEDPHKIPSIELVQRSLASGITAFDTSPYYGPSEEILGAALTAPNPTTNEPWQRESYNIITKVGRIAAEEFDYSPEWVRKSVARSLKRLQTTYLDLVYCHDVEFVTTEDALGAIKELRRIRDEEGTIRYVGICGYPVAFLCDLAELVLRETGEPLDAVQSYSNFTLQSTLLKSVGVERLKKAGVSVVPNAGILGMGLLRSQGVPSGGMGNWHPAPDGLREACARASKVCANVGENSERLEVVATRWALEAWLDAGAEVGTTRSPFKDGKKVGVSVIGVGTLTQLEEALMVWRSITTKREAGNLTLEGPMEEVWKALGEWKDWAWKSPEEGWVCKPSKQASESRV